jgi:pimeloyl-ACP methyl ester carboxylesterase
MRVTPKSRRGPRYWFNLLLVGFLGGVVMLLVGYEVAYIAWVTGRADAPLCCRTPADLGLAYESIALTAPDGVKLSGWYLPSQNHSAVIMLHGYGANRLELLDRAAILARAGFGVLLYDQRGHGESGGSLRSFGWADVSDVDAAVAWLGGRDEVDTDRLGIFGFSIGGQVALRAAAANPVLRAVAADGPSVARTSDAPPPADLEERLYQVVGRVDDWAISLRTGVPAPAGVLAILAHISPRPLLLISTGGPGDFEHRRVASYYRAAEQPKTLLEIPEAAHGGGFAARPEVYTETLIQFYEDALTGE